MAITESHLKQLIKEEFLSIREQEGETKKKDIQQPSKEEMLDYLRHVSPEPESLIMDPRELFEIWAEEIEKLIKEKNYADAKKLYQQLSQYWTSEKFSKKWHGGHRFTDALAAKEKIRFRKIFNKLSRTFPKDIVPMLWSDREKEKKLYHKQLRRGTFPTELKTATTIEKEAYRLISYYLHEKPWLKLPGRVFDWCRFEIGRRVTDLEFEMDDEDYDELECDYKPILKKLNLTEVDLRDARISGSAIEWWRRKHQRKETTAGRAQMSADQLAMTEARIRIDWAQDFINHLQDFKKFKSGTCYTRGGPLTARQLECGPFGKNITYQNYRDLLDQLALLHQFELSDAYEKAVGYSPFSRGAEGVKAVRLKDSRRVPNEAHEQDIFPYEGDFRSLSKAHLSGDWIPPPSEAVCKKMIELAGPNPFAAIYKNRWFKRKALPHFRDPADLVKYFRKVYRVHEWKGDKEPNYGDPHAVRWMQTVASDPIPYSVYKSRIVGDQYKMRTEYSFCNWPIPPGGIDIRNALQRKTTAEAILQPEPDMRPRSAREYDAAAQEGPTMGPVEYTIMALYSGGWAGLRELIKWFGIMYVMEALADHVDFEKLSEEGFGDPHIHRDQ